VGEHVSSADLIRNFSYWQHRAALGPLTVTYHGKPRYILVAKDAWDAVTHDGPVGAIGDGRALEYDFLVEHMDGGLLLLDSELAIYEASTSAALLLGRTRSELEAQPLRNILPLSVAGAVVEHLRDVLRDGEQSQFDLRWDGPGDARLRVRAFPWVRGVAMILRVHYANDENIRLAEHSALDMARRAHGGVSIVRMTLRGTIAMVDAELTAQLGLSRDQLLGLRFVDLLDLKDRPTTREAIEQVLGGVLDSAVIEVDMLSNKGGKLKSRVAMAPLIEGYAIGGAILLLTPRG
jgi:PAS domain-containing protein